MSYLGYEEVLVQNGMGKEVYTSQKAPDSFLENEYLIVKDPENNVLDYFKNKKGVFQRLNYPVLDNTFTGKIKPRNPHQYCAIDLLKDNDIPVKLITGKFGVGKSMLCIVAALQLLSQGQFDKIVFVRNNVQVKDTDALGALPGDIEQKYLPYLMPFADHCGGAEGVKMLVEKGALEVIPLAFMRGRSIRKSIIYSMESENLTKEHIQLLLGRVDEGSQLWMDGDIKQRDKAIFEKSAGLEQVVDRLSGNPLFGYVHLQKTERSATAALADLLD